MSNRTDQEIVDQTNELARICLRFIGTGYEVPENYRFYVHLGDRRYPRENKAWEAACAVQEFMTATDPNDALASLEEPISGYSVAPEHRERLLDETEKLLGELRCLGNPSLLLNALSDSPKPGSKPRARQAFMEMLTQLHALRVSIHNARQIPIVGNHDEVSDD